MLEIPNREKMWNETSQDADEEMPQNSQDAPHV